MSSSQNSILSCNRLNAGYPKRPVLHDVNFEVESREWLGLIGPNGSGKTTLLQCLNSNLPFDGEIFYKGRNLSSFSIRELASTMAYLRQNPNSGFSLTAREVASLGLLPHRGYLSRNSLQEQVEVEELFEELGLSKMLDRNLDAMSGGEQRMIFLAQAILQNPDLILLDEPTVHLDPGRQFEFLNKVEDMRQQGLTVISVFHDINLACRFVSRLMTLKNGKITAIGQPSEILKAETIHDLFGVNSEIRSGPDGKTSVVMYS